MQMEVIMEWVVNHPVIMSSVGIVILEFITKITPTKTDDGFVQRLGVLIKTIIDLTGIKDNIKDKSVKVD